MRHRTILRGTILLIFALMLGTSPLLAGACAPGTVAEPASFDTVIRPALAEDTNPDPNIVEVFLTAREAVWDFGAGNMTEVFTFNGIIPGPMIEANLGDTLIVHLCNDLPAETTIHWHGVETPANMDGSNIAQGAVFPGQTFTYEFPLLKSGTFWYHPHIQTNVQVEKGMYGALIVRDPEEDEVLNLPADEHVFILDDVWLDEDGQIVEPFLGDREDVALEQLNGREGDTLLLNGVRRPDLNLERGVPHRIRMINAANARFMRMSVPEIPMWRIGGDQGLLEAPLLVQPAVNVPTDPPPDPPADSRHPSDPDPTTGVLMTPGERADVVLVLQGDTSQEPLRFEWHDMQRGRHSVDFLPDGTVVLAHNVPDGDQLSVNVGRIFLFGESGVTEWTPPLQLRDIIPIDVTGALRLPLILGHTIPDWKTGETIFFIQAPGKPFPALRTNDVHTVNTNGTYIWEVRNMTGSHHNFHTHGWDFQHIETEFVDLDFPEDPERNFIEPARFLENKDVFLLKRRPGIVPFRSWSISRFAVHFSDTGRVGQVSADGKLPRGDHSGGWLAHCHLLEHSRLGMMTFFQVTDLLVDSFETGDLSGWSSSSLQQVTQPDPSAAAPGASADGSAQGAGAVAISMSSAAATISLPETSTPPASSDR